MSTPYVAELNALKAKLKHIPKEIKDQWRTPDWLFYALDHLYGPLVVDLFTDYQNSKCEHFFGAEDNAIVQDWKTKLEAAKFDMEIAAEACGYYFDDGEVFKCFANPPYSPSKYIGKGKNKQAITGMTHIMKKAYDEHKRGVPSVWLLKSATSEDWWPNETASQIIHIKGRIGFEPPVWFKDEVKGRTLNGASFGASVVIFNGKDDIQLKEEYIYRDDLRKIGEPIAAINAEARKKWIDSFDEL